MLHTSSGKSWVIGRAVLAVWVAAIVRQRFHAGLKLSGIRWLRRSPHVWLSSDLFCHLTLIVQHGRGRTSSRLRSGLGIRWPSECVVTVLWCVHKHCDIQRIGHGLLGLPVVWATPEACLSAPAIDSQVSFLTGLHPSRFDRSWQLLLCIIISLRALPCIVCPADGPR